MFIVMDPPLLATETGALMYERLAADLTALGAKRAWVREYARDTTILSFFAQRGFVERDRFAPPGYEEVTALPAQAGSFSGYARCNHPR